MTDLDETLREFPAPVRTTIEGAWSLLSDEERTNLQVLLQDLPIALDPLKRIFGLVLDQYKPLIEKRSIAILGPANVGKSTLYNQLVSAKEDRAEVGPVPGTTRENQEADVGLFSLTDTPGADAVGAVGERERQIAFEAAERADLIVLVYEATRGVKRYERALFDRLTASGKPFVVVLNKMDLIDKRQRQQVLEAAALNLDLESAQIIGTVAEKGENVGRVVLAITKFEPGLLAAIAEAMPEYRARLAWQRIVPAASGAAVVGLAPLPIMDLIPLLAIQSGLVLSLSRIYGYRLTLRRAKELIATFGLGFAARYAFQQLSKLGGVPGWVLSASVAAATTAAMGIAAMNWFAYGERPTRKALSGSVRAIAGYLREQLRGGGEKKPDKRTLRARMRNALTNLPRRLLPRRAEETEGSDPEPAPTAESQDPEG
jgi:small GTP-binding protein